MADHSRAKKSGLGADIDKKQEDRYDAEEAAGVMDCIVEWVNEVVGADHEKIASSGQREMHRALANGVMLCKLINKLSEHCGKKCIGFKKNANTTFVAMGNIESYNKACLEYGLGKEFTFQSTDLWEGRKAPFLNVINGLHSLGFEANAKGYPVLYKGQIEKYLDNQ